MAGVVIATTAEAVGDENRRAIKDHAQVREVSLSRRDIDDAKRLLALLADHEDESAGSALPGALHQAIRSQREQLVSHARRILTLRRKRTKRFGKAMFSEPAWEMLLLLYATQDAEQLTVSRLALLSGASKATALRWIEYLVGQNWIERKLHPTDKRATFVSMTEKGKDALDAYLFESIGLNS